jgi:ribosomal protein S18 acetylase RimI-like enzyme
MPTGATTAVLERRRNSGSDAAGPRVRFIPVTADNLCGWLAMATPGDATVYYRGYLGRDRCRSAGALADAERQRVITVARQALLAAQEGRVHLLQRRHGDGDYSYIVVKARHQRRGVGRARAVWGTL